MHIPVVLDLFDNYFSWSAAAMQREIHWQWLRALKSASLVISSSAFLTRTLMSLTDIPVLQVSDLVPPVPSGSHHPQRLARKWDAPRAIELLWFGISANPYFLVGLEDVVRSASMIRELTALLGAEHPVRLTLCTNRVPAVDQCLQVLRAEQVDARFVEWQSETCDKLLDDTHVVLLPTSASAFALSKTHNRCSDALARGCLVLASERGPYEGLAGAVFEDHRALVQQLRNATAGSIAGLLRASYQALSGRHQIDLEVGALCRHLDTLGHSTGGEPAAQPRVLLLATPSAAAAGFASKSGWLVADCSTGLPRGGADLRFDPIGAPDASATLQLSEKAMARLEAQLARDVDADSEECGAHLDIHMDHWHLRLDRGGMQLCVLRGLHDDVAQHLNDALAGGLAGQAGTVALVGAMAQVLHRLGIGAMSFAGEDSGAWAAYARWADPDLAALEGRLQNLWITHEGREWAWGRSGAEVLQ
jgi:hypothetical protein